MDSATPVWLDCDPGHDDAMAIILAGYNPSLKLLGVSTVFGNTKIENTTENACKIVWAAGMDVPVVRGKEGPICKDDFHNVINSEEIHGDSGLGIKGGYKLPESQIKPLNKNAILYMFNTIMESPKKVKVIITGVMTNVALLIKSFPEVKENIDSVVFMGGAITVGNVTPAAEANIRLDPEAAEIVCNSGLRVVMVPLEVTHTALVTPDVTERILKMGTKFSKIVDGLMQFFTESYKEVFNFEYPPLHDPCAVAYCIAPEIFEGDDMCVEIERTSEKSRGRTICGMFAHHKKYKNVFVTQKMDVPKFWDLMIAALEVANSKNRVEE